LYDRHSEALGLECAMERITPRPSPVNVRYEVAGVEGEVPDIRFLVGTSTAGLLLFHGARPTRLFEGIDFFGLSRRDDRWYAFQRYGNCGRIISFRLEDDRAVDARTELAGLSRGIHQIDFIEDDLWIVDTYRDRVLVVPVESIGRRWRRVVRKLYPIGRSGIGLGQPNHAHFNSIYRWRDGIYLVAHNDTTKTGRGSDLFLLDLAGNVKAREPMGGSCCHNIGVLDGKRVTCRSREGVIAVDGKEVLPLGPFLRGLSLGPDYHVVGKSAAGSDRKSRDAADGAVLITDAGFSRLIATIRLTGTQVHEIRRLDIDDLGLSSTPHPDLSSTPGHR
jgi:hypothetical protein